MCELSHWCTSWYHSPPSCCIQTFLFRHYQVDLASNPIKCWNFNSFPRTKVFFFFYQHKLLTIVFNQQISLFYISIRVQKIPTCERTRDAKQLILWLFLHLLKWRMCGYRRISFEHYICFPLSIFSHNRFHTISRHSSTKNQLCGDYCDRIALHRHNSRKRLQKYLLPCLGCLMKWKVIFTRKKCLSIFVVICHKQFSSTKKLLSLWENHYVLDIEGVDY